jgi:hypothetical protein
MSVSTIDEGDVPTTLTRLPGRIGQPSLSLSFSLLSFFLPSPLFTLRRLIDDFELSL